MHIRELLAGLALQWVKAPVGAGSSIDGNSSRIDMIDYESALFIVPIDDSVATGVATLKVEQNDADSDTGMAAITGASASSTSVVNDDLNGKLLVVEVHHPSKRYIQGVVTSSVANIAYGDMVVLLRPRQFPVTQGDTVAASAYVSD